MEIVEKLGDPKLKWYISKLFGRRVYYEITAPNQTLHICDDMVCLPIRFSELPMWYYGGMPWSDLWNLYMAWDHRNETNPITEYPRDGSSIFIPGYEGWLWAVDVTDGTNRTVMHVVRKHKQLLVVNRGYYIRDGTRYNVNIRVVVNFPPSGLNLAYATNGTVYPGGVGLDAGQYVLFYPSGESPYPVDTTNGLFASSPMGSSPTYTYEARVPKFTRKTVEVPDIYLGIKATKDVGTRFPFVCYGGMFLRTPVNVGAGIESCPGFEVYDNDPHCYAGTWAGSRLGITWYTGWAEDDAGNVKYMLMSQITLKHSTKWEPATRADITRIYDAQTDEIYHMAVVKPLKDIYSYGRMGAVTMPTLCEWFPGEYYVGALGPASKVIIVRPDDSHVTLTGPTNTCWEWNDGYGSCSVFGNRVLCYEFLAFYTDDPAINITNPKDMGMNRCNVYPDPTVAYAQVKPFMDRSLRAGRVYAAIARSWEMPVGLSDAEYANAIKKYVPKVLTADEWNKMITNIPPFTPMMYGIPETAREITYTLPRSVAAGESITISGTVTGPAGPHALKTIRIQLLSPNNIVVATAETSTDTAGNFSATIRAPTMAGTYKVVIVITP